MDGEPEELVEAIRSWCDLNFLSQFHPTYVAIYSDQACSQMPWPGRNILTWVIAEE